MERERLSAEASVSSPLLPLQAGMRHDLLAASSLAMSMSIDMLVDVEKADSIEAAEWMAPLTCISDAGLSAPLTSSWEADSVRPTHMQYPPVENARVGLSTGDRPFCWHIGGQHVLKSQINLTDLIRCNQPWNDI